MGRDTVWYELLEAMEEGGCPVCALKARMRKREMDAFLYASVNDRGLRKKITASNGFCSRHAHVLMAMGDPVAHAILYRGLLESQCAALTPETKISVGKDHSACIFCRSEQNSEESYAKAFASFWGDEEFRGRYRESGLLCVGHLDMVRAFLKKKEAVADLNRVTKEKYEALIGNLSGILEKSDYRHAGEPLTPDERTAWKRAVRVINGGE